MEDRERNQTGSAGSLVQRQEGLQTARTTAEANEAYLSLTPEQRDAHREKVGLRIEAILDQFWRDDDTSDAQRALEIEGWVDVLETCSHSEIRWAWAEYQKTGPRTRAGRLYKPDAGALYRLIIKRRPAPPPPPAEPPPPPRGPRVPPEDVQATLRSLGVKVMPKPDDGEQP